MKKSNEGVRVPMRRCVGCNTSKPKGTLIRIAFDGENLSVDPQAKKDGRGVYVCRNPECIAAAEKKGGIKRGFRRNFPQEELDRVFKEINEEC